MEIYNLDQFFNSNLPLNDQWILWRRINEEKEFIPILSFSTVESLGLVLNSIDYKGKSRFTLMKNSIKPIWEDKHHVNGGYFTVDIDENLPRDKVVLIMKSFICGLVGRTLVSDFDINLITGISLIFNEDYHQFRLWVSDFNIPMTRKNINDEFWGVITNIYHEHNIKKEISVVKSRFIVLERKNKHMTRNNDKSKNNKKIISR